MLKIRLNSARVCTVPGVWASCQEFSGRQDTKGGGRGHGLALKELTVQARVEVRHE